MHKLLQKALKVADQAEVMEVRSTGHTVNFDSGQLKSIEEKKTTGLGLRLISNGRIGFSSTTDEKEPDSVIEAASASSRFGPDALFDFPSGALPESPELHDARIDSFTIEEAVHEGKKAVDLIQQKYPEITTDVQLNWGVIETKLHNSKGFEGATVRTSFSVQVTGLVIEDDGLWWVWEGGTYGRYKLDMNDIVQALTDKVKQAKKVALIPTGKKTVIFTARQMPYLLTTIEMGVDGIQLQKGVSPLKDRENKRIVSENITILDDPTISFGVGSGGFDDEGVPMKKQILFQNGIFQDFLFDLKTAGLMGKKSTGSARRDYQTQPSVGFSNMVVECGESKLTEMIQDTQDGLLIYGTLGGGQSNMLNGDFSLNVMLGFRIESGEIIGRVSDVMISGNVYELLNRMKYIGSDSQEIGNCIVPDICFEDVSVTALR